MMKKSDCCLSFSLLSLLLSLVVGCAADDSAYSSDCVDCVDFPYPEAGTESGYDMEFPPPSSAGGTPNIDCRYLATANSGQQACLDDLDNETRSRFYDDLDAWCNQAEALSQQLSIYEATVCEDRDEDCWYHCDSWTLPTQWQDRDDRRALVLGDESARVNDPNVVFDDEMSAEDFGEEGSEAPVGHTNAPPEVSASLCVNQALAEDDTQYACRHQLESSVLKITACEADALAMIIQTGEQFELVLQKIEESSLYESRRVSLDFEPRDLLCTLDNSGGWIILLFGEQTTDMFTYTSNRIESLNESPDISDLLGSVTTDMAALESFTINQQGLQTWSYSVTSPIDTAGNQGLFTFHRLNNGPVSSTTPNNPVIAQQSLCLEGYTVDNLNLRSAYLNDDASVTLSDENTDFEYELFSQFKPFQALHSSELFLALSPQDLGERLDQESQKLIFSLWGDATDLSEANINDSLLPFPLIFDAEVWGYESVTLSQLVGSKALLRLRVKLEEAQDENIDPNDIKYAWGVYDILTDHLQIFEALQFAQSLGGTEEEFVFSDPKLHPTWLSWQLQYNGEKYLITQQLNTTNN